MKKISVLFDASDKIYQDHFPGNPVVPGSFVIEAVCRILNKETVNTENFRFKKFMKPDSYDFILEEYKNGWKLIVEKEGVKYVTGKIY